MSDARIDQFSSSTMTGIFASLLILVPLIFVPVFQQAFETPKLLVIAFATIGICLTWAVSMVMKKSLHLTLHPFTLPTLFYIVTFLISTFFSPITFNQSLSSIEGIMFFLSIALLVAPTLWQKVQEQTFLEIGLSISMVLTLIGVLQLFGVGPTLILNALFPFKFTEGFQFSPTGSPLVTLSFILPFYIAAIVDLVVHQHIKDKLFQLIAVILLTIGIFVHLWRLFPGMPDSPVMLPPLANWQIAVDSIKNPMTGLFGFGPNGFVDAFTLYKPVSLNALPTWNILYQTGSNAPLNLLVSLGFLGLFSWLFLAVQMLKSVRQSSRNQMPIIAGAITALILQLLIPMNLVLLTIFFVFLTIWVVILQTEDKPSVISIFFQFVARAFHRQTEEHNKTFSLLPYITATLIGIMTLFLSYVLLMNMIAEIFHFRYLLAMQGNNGSQAYSNIQTTIKFNQSNDLYHRSYAQINFALANALSSKEEPTEEERTQIAQFMQQAIRETRIAASLNPRSTQNWKTMAETYRALIGSVEESDRFTLAAYTQAISTFPNDPALRVDLGGIFLKANNYTQAGELFSQAARLKPDYANALYNWGKALEGQQDYVNALTLYKRTLPLIPEDSADRAVIEEDIESMESKVASMPKTGDVAGAKTNASPTPSPMPKEDEQVDETLSEEPEEVAIPPQPKPQSELLETEPEIQNASESSESAN